MSMGRLLAVSAYGPDADYTDTEAALMSASLVNILERTSDNAFERAMSFSDPLILAAGVLMWGNRLVNLASAPPDEDAMSASPDQDTMPAPPDQTGFSVERDIADHMYSTREGGRYVGSTR